MIFVEKQNKSKLDIEIYRCGNTNINDIKEIFDDNPLNMLNVKPEYNENAICYKNVLIDDFNTEISKLYEIVKNASKNLLKYFE